MDKIIEKSEDQAVDFQASGIKELGELELAFVGGGIADMIGG